MQHYFGAAIFIASSITITFDLMLNLNKKLIYCLALQCSFANSDVLHKAMPFPAFPTTPDNDIKQLNQEYWGSIQETLLKQKKHASEAETSSFSLWLSFRQEELLAKLADQLTGDEKKALLELIAQLHEISSLDLSYLDEQSSDLIVPVVIGHPSYPSGHILPEQYHGMIPGILCTPLGKKPSSRSEHTEDNSSNTSGTTTAANDELTDSTAADTSLPPSVSQLLDDSESKDVNLAKLYKVIKRLRDRALELKCGEFPSSSEPDGKLYSRAVIMGSAKPYIELQRLLSRLTIYLDYISRYQIPHAGTVDFAALYKLLGVTYDKNKSCFNIAANVVYGTRVIYNLLARLNQFFLDDYRFFSVVNWKEARIIAEWLSNTGLTNLLEIAGGIGWWQLALSGHGIKITATDNFHFVADDSAQRLKLAGDVIHQDWIDAIKQRNSQHDALLLAFPDNPGFMAALDLWGVDKPILFISNDGVDHLCRLVHKRCHTRPFAPIPLPELNGWSAIFGYLKLEVFYWLGADDF